MDSCKPESIKKQAPVRLLFQGLFNSGKTSVMLQLQDGKFLPDRAHIGEFDICTTIEGTELQATTYDRREYYKHFFKLHYRFFDGIVCVIDSNDKELLETAIEDMEVFFEQKELQAKVMLVLANKQDIDGALPVSEIEKQVMKKVSAYKRTMQGKTIFVAGCSAKTREGLDKAMSQIIEKIKEKKVEELEKKPGRRFLKKLVDIPFLKSFLTR